MATTSHTQLKTAVNVNHTVDDDYDGDDDDDDDDGGGELRMIKMNIPRNQELPISD